VDDIDVGRHRLPEPGDEPLVLLQGDDPSRALGEPGREGTLARPDLDDDVFRLRIDGADDLP
jgi:hypothetical protein